MGWDYILNLFKKESPGALKLYQDHCRIYLDEYPEQLDVYFRKYVRTPIDNENNEIIDILETRRKYKEQ